MNNLQAAKDSRDSQKQVVERKERLVQYYDAVIADRTAERSKITASLVGLKLKLAQAEVEVKELEELEQAAAKLRAAGYIVMHITEPYGAHTTQAAKADTAVSGGGHQARPTPAVPRANYDPAHQHVANAAAYVRAAAIGASAYEWRPPASASSGPKEATPDWVVRSSLACTYGTGKKKDGSTHALIHVPSGHETVGFPDFASIGRYIRGRIKYGCVIKNWSEHYSSDQYRSA